MAKIEYEGYTLLALADFTFSYIEGHKQVNFYFDPGGVNTMVVSSKPVSCSDGVSQEDVTRALDRLVTHLKSVGYKVIIS